MSRYKAALIHLLISAVLVGNVIGIVLWIWYPKPTFEVLEVFPIVRLLVGVDLGIGPLLTLIVYKHGKPGLKFDLTVIALIQIVALVYGSYRLHEEKPDYLVFAVDRLEFISKNRIDPSLFAYDESQAKRFANLVQVFARFPEDPEEYQRYFDSIVVDGKPDLESRPEYWEPWSEGTDVIRKKVKSIEDINPDSADERKNIEQAIEKYSEAHPNLGVIPLGGIEKNMGMLLDRDTLEILDVLNANPWLSN
jgi:hypothetical protein